MKHSDFKRITAVCLLWILVFAACGKTVSPQETSPDEPYDVFVHFIDVGQGDAALICTPDGNVLIDTGTPESADVLLGYLRAQKADSLAYLILSHPHLDHIGGASAVLDACIVDRVILPEVTSTLWTFEELLDKIAAKNCAVSSGAAGVSFSVGKVEFSILAPGTVYEDDLNNDSLVVRMQYGDTSFLFLGDAQTAEEEELLGDDRSLLDVDVLKVAHHGSITSSSPAFLAAVSPKVAVISVGSGNTYGHPSHTVIDRLEDLGALVLRTDKIGDIVISSNGKEILTP